MYPIKNTEIAVFVIFVDYGWLYIILKQWFEKI